MGTLAMTEFNIQDAEAQRLREDAVAVNVSAFSSSNL
jgi:hypothetical protein